MATYNDFSCAHKVFNNDYIAFTANHISKQFRGCGGDVPKWIALLLDGVNARSMMTLHRRVGLDKDNITIVEHDRETFDTLSANHPDCNFIFGQMQSYVQKASFPSDQFNLAFFDWMCTINGNNNEGRPLEALSNFLCQTNRPYIVLAQTFCLRGEQKGNGDPYQASKDRVCNAIIRTAARNGYQAMWNSYFESVYRREGGAVPMFFTCVVLVQNPGENSPEYLWAFYEKNQLHMRDR